MVILYYYLTGVFGMSKKYKMIGFLLGVIATVLNCVPAYATTTYNSNTKAIYSSAKLKKNFGSKTNPKKGTKTATASLPASNGFVYGDFALFNSLASENKLGGTPIYILGTIKSVEKLATTGDVYYGAFLVDGCDGYQWCATMDIAKGNFDLTKLTYTGKNAYVYGLYDGYSTDLCRPLLDITSIVLVNDPQQAIGSVETTVASAVMPSPTQIGSEDAVTNSTNVYDNMVWIPKTGGKYHTKSDCSGMKYPRQVSLQEAQSKGYTPCGDCYNK